MAIVKKKRKNLFDPGTEMDMDYNPEPEPKKRKVSLKIKASLWGIFIFLAVFDIAVPAEGYASGYNALQLFFIALFAAVFSTLCAKIAEKMERNIDLAWAIGFLFGIFGLMGYGLYYLLMRLIVKKDLHRPRQHAPAKKADRKPGKKKK